MQTQNTQLCSDIRAAYPNMAPTTSEQLCLISYLGVTWGVETSASGSGGARVHSRPDTQDGPECLMGFPSERSMFQSRLSQSARRLTTDAQSQCHPHLLKRKRLQNADSGPPAGVASRALADIRKARDKGLAPSPNYSLQCHQPF